MRTAKPYGPDAPTLASSKLEQSACDGGYQARHPGESTEQPLKPSRREGRMFRRVPVVTAACFFCCRRAMGAAEHPAFPAPSSFEGTRTMQNPDRSCRGKE
jgi:hypothetical protein